MLENRTKVADCGIAIVVHHYRAQDGSDFVSFFSRREVHGPHWQASVFGRATNIAPRIEFQVLGKKADSSLCPTELGLVITNPSKCTVDIKTYQDGKAFNVVTKITEGHAEESATERYHLLGCMETEKGTTHWVYASNSTYDRHVKKERATHMVPVTQRC